MSDGLFHFLILAASFLGLFALGELGYHVLKLKGETTRKFVHIGTGLLTMTFPLLLDSILLVSALCLSFLVILIASQRFGFLKSINDIDRKSHGSALYPIIVMLIYTFYSFQQYDAPDFFRFDALTFFYLPILVMAIADPMAAIVGKSYPMGVYSLRKQQKTLSGSAAFFITAVALGFCFIDFSAWWLVLLMALSSAIVEGLSKDGFDNFSIPFAVALNLYLFT